jgi:methylase of polypeptide subunit release factors
MALWAQIGDDNIITQVTVGDDNDPDRGHGWLTRNLGGRWVETSRDGSVHHVPAGIGHRYCDEHDSFACHRSCEEGNFIRKWWGRESERDETFFREMIFRSPQGAYAPDPLDMELDCIINYVSGLAAATVVDVGAGVGNVGICIAVAKPGTQVVMVEPNKIAANAARVNAEALAPDASIEVVVGEMASVSLGWLDGSVDVIVSNSPSYPDDTYVELEGLEYPAAYGGGDGLDVIREILGAARTLLSPSGMVIFRSGHYSFEETVERVIDGEVWGVEQLHGTFVRAVLRDGTMKPQE